MPTTNPVPSTDPGDLLYNAQKLDEVVTGTADSYTDRLGVSRLTLTGAMRLLGYEAPVAFASGLSITRASQTVTNGGNTYHANPASLPFTTAATFNASQWRAINNITYADMTGYAIPKAGATDLAASFKTAGTWSGSRLEVDANFAASIIGGAPTITFDAGDMLRHNRASNTVEVVVAGSVVCSFQATGPERASDAASPNGLVRKQQAEAIAASAVSAVPGRNRIINGAFAINQRAFGGGALAAGVYGHDRWKAGSSGCTYSVSGEVATITAGSLQQVIEGLNVVEGGTYTLSWSGTAQARVDGGSYASSPITVTGKTAGANTAIEFGTGTVSRVQYESGSSASAFERRLHSVEMAACLRYYATSAACSNLLFNGYCSNGNTFRAQVSLPVTMRAAPTVIGANAGDFGFPGSPGTLSSGVGYIREQRVANSTQSPGFYETTWTASAEL